MPAFTVSVGEKFIFKKKRGDPALKVTNDGGGQLGHLQREPVPVLACFYRFWITWTIKILVNSGLIEIFLFSNCFKYIHVLEGDLSNSTGCVLSFCQTKSNQSCWRVRLVQLSSVTEPIKQQSDWLGAIEYVGFIRLTTPG